MRRPVRPAPSPGRARRAVRRWRRTRPFWAGILTIAAGLEILLIPVTPLGLVVNPTTAGVSSLLIGALLAACGILLWCAPAQRAFTGVAAVLLALTSFVTANLGGFLLGMLLGIVGGSLGFAWTYTPAGGGRDAAGGHVAQGGDDADRVPAPRSAQPTPARSSSPVP